MVVIEESDDGEDDNLDMGSKEGVMVLVVSFLEKGKEMG